jgi:hypothetical protein
MKDDDDTMCYRSELEAAVKAEREACAELAFEMLVKVEGTDFDVPDAIRARGNT